VLGCGESSLLTNPNTWLAIAALLSFFIFAVAAWLFHRRLRNRSSLHFLLSVFALLILPFVLSIVTFLVLTYSSPEMPGKPTMLNNWVVISAEIIVPGLLLLLVASTFFRAVRTIAPQPNNSFKPNPLRGSA
jgi:uncharacterized membrane protein